jgi:hypothetical protein
MKNYMINIKCCTFEEYGKQYTILEYPDGGKIWNYKSSPHRDYGPALQYTDGTDIWYKHGIRHRDDGGAVLYVEDGVSYYLDSRHVSFYNLTFKN